MKFIIIFFLKELNMTNTFKNDLNIPSIHIQSNFSNESNPVRKHYY